MAARNYSRPNSSSRKSVIAFQLRRAEFRLIGDAAFGHVGAFVGEAVPRPAIGMDLPVGVRCGQFGGERDGRLGRCNRIVPAMADQQFRPDRRDIGERGWIVDAVEAHHAKQVGTGARQIDRAFPTEAESDRGRSRRIDLGQRLQFRQRTVKPVAQ